MADRPPIAPPLFRAAREADANALAAFSCGDDPWSREVESFIREAALPCHLGDPPPDHYPHTLIVAEDDHQGIIGVGAVRRGPIVLWNGGQLNGIVLVVLALATGSQGTTIAGDGRLSHTLAREVIATAAQGRRTNETVFGIVDCRNCRSLKLVAELGFKKQNEFGAVGRYHDVHRTSLAALLDRLDELR